MGSQRIGHDLATEQQQQKPCRQVSIPGIPMTGWEHLAIRLACVLYIILMWNKSCFTSWYSCFLFPWLWISFLFLWSTALFLRTSSGKPDDPPLPHCTHSPSFPFPGHHQQFKAAWTGRSTEGLGPWSNLVAQLVKSLPAMWETQVLSLGGEGPLEKEMATHSSTFAWKIPWTDMGSQSQRQLSY